jgi:hypothetical protein
MARSQQEIVDRVRAMEDGKIETDMFNFEKIDLIEWLTYDNAKQFLKESVTEQDWLDSDPSKTVAQQIADYLPFALEKTQDHRGLSAMRSICHYRAWLWLDEKRDLLDFISDDNNYAEYGVPMLKAIGEEYSLDLPTEEEWFQNMAAGKECQPNCMEGCA